MPVNFKDIGAGLSFIAIGLLFAVGTTQLQIGTPNRMGPGFFPLILSGILIAIGVVVTVSAWRSVPEALGKLPVRALALIALAIVTFAATVRGLGLVPAVFIVSFIASLASRRNSLVSSAIVAAVLTVFSFIVFTELLRLPTRPLGPWLRFLGF